MPGFGTKGYLLSNKNVADPKAYRLEISGPGLRFIVIYLRMVRTQAPSTRIRRFCIRKFFMQIHLASTRVRRIRSVYPEISVYALQSGNICIHCIRIRVDARIHIFLYTLTSQYQNQSFSARDFPKWRRAETLCVQCY